MTRKTVRLGAIVTAHASSAKGGALTAVQVFHGVIHGFDHTPVMGGVCIFIQIILIIR